MILIITTDNDPVTSRICMWLLHNKTNFRIISGGDAVDVLKIERDSIQLKNQTRDYILELKCVKKFLYRQGDVILSKSMSKTDDENLAVFLKREKGTLHEFLHSKFEEIYHLGHPKYADLNKLVLLEKATRFNLLVPEYIFTGSKANLVAFRNKYPEVITKIILPGYSYVANNARYGSYTELLSKDDMNDLEDDFHATFFQKYIPKKFDVRVFYVDQTFYSIAIISQNNIETKVDFRVYDTELRNRNIAFKLPKKLEENLQKMITHLDLNYCSIDFVYGEDKNFYFLEINPIGQFGNVSYFGNYYLEKKIAQLLSA